MGSQWSRRTKPRTFSRRRRNSTTPSTACTRSSRNSNRSKKRSQNSGGSDRLPHRAALVLQHFDVILHGRHSKLFPAGLEAGGVVDGNEHGQPVDTLDLCSPVLTFSLAHPDAVVEVGIVAA